MRNFRLNFKMDWKSKLIDLLIVIVGISIAFQLNNWNESKKTNQKATEYIMGFYDENEMNHENLVSALEFSESAKADVDTLKQILLSKKYSDMRMKSLVASMMALANFSPLTTTMENITATGEFNLIKDIELRKNIISTYNSYTTTAKLESITTDYINKYLTPFFFENVRFSDFSSINSDFISDPLFENIVLGYEILLNQQINGYRRNLGKLNLLNENLTTVKTGNIK